LVTVGFIFRQDVVYKDVSRQDVVYKIETSFLSVSFILFIFCC